MPIQWYFKRDGREHGPVTSEDLRMLASLGMLHPTDPVRKAEMTRWAKASALKGLFPAETLQTKPAHAPVPTPGISAPPTPSPLASKRSVSQLPVAASFSKWIWYLTATAALFVVAGGVYRIVLEPAEPRAVARLPEPVKQLPAADPILASEMTDPLVTAISSESPFDRGMALRQIKYTTIPLKLRGQVHQIICDTLDNRAFSSIWSSAACALGEVGSADDLSRLKPLIDQAPVETQCAAMATAMVLDPQAGIRLFEPHAADETYVNTTAGYLADWGPRCEPVALEMLKSPERMCRSHALFLLKAFGTSKAIDALAAAKKSEVDKLIADGYQLTMDAISSRNQ